MIVLRRVSLGLFLLLTSTFLLFSGLIPHAAAQQGPLFQKTWGGSGIDFGRGVAIDSSGNVYTTGYTFSFGPGHPGRSALTLLKYNQTGTLIWQKIWSGSGNGTDSGSGVAVDSSGSIYVTGATTSFGAGLDDVLLLKFDSSGSLLWQKTWGGSGNDLGQGVALDSSGNAYVSGFSTSFGTNIALAVLLKFSPSGNLLWQRTWGSMGEYGRGVAVDSSGNIYQTGYTNSTGGGGFNLFLLKYNSTGSLIWQKTWGGTSLDFGYGVAADSSGNAYLTGQTSSYRTGIVNVVILKFGSAGGLVWQRTWGGSSFDAGYGVALDASNGVYVTGETNSYGAGADNILLLKLDTSGNLVWHRTWGGSNSDVGNSVAVDTVGDAILAGYVGAAPPYTLGTAGNSTLGMPIFSPGTPSFTPVKPTFTLHIPSGTVQTPAGSQYYAGGFDQFLLKYGTLPTVTFQTNPTTGGSISFNGTTYTNSQNGNYTYETVTISAQPPAGYMFNSWSSTGGISVASPGTSPTTATISGPGSLTANFTNISSSPLYPEGTLLAGLIIAVTVTLTKRRREFTR